MRRRRVFQSRTRMKQCSVSLEILIGFSSTWVATYEHGASTCDILNSGQEQCSEAASYQSILHIHCYQSLSGKRQAKKRSITACCIHCDGLCYPTSRRRVRMCTKMGFQRLIGGWISAAAELCMSYSKCRRQQGSQPTERTMNSRSQILVQAIYATFF